VLFGEEGMQRLNVEEGIGERLLLGCSGSRRSSPRSSCWFRSSRSATSGRRVPHKLESGIYFAALGLGFMFFEVSLIQS
jgi:hypothetical protein